MSDEVLVRVEGVSKKFCRSLKKSLWYGMQDLGNELRGRRHGGDGELRPDEFWAVKDVSFELRRGECLGLIGRNGAGKTTLLRMLNGLIKPDRGRIEMRGRVGALIALGAGFNPVLTGRENIYVNASVLGLTKQETDSHFEEIVEFAELEKFIDSPVQSYSSGMAVRLGFAIAVKTNPDILLLDEVLAVGDVSFQAKCFNALAHFRSIGTAFILVSHNMHQMSRYANRVICLQDGLIKCDSDADQCISIYLTESKETSSLEENSKIDWSIINGSGRAIFTGARFLDSAGNQVSEIEVGRGFILEIDYICSLSFTKSWLLDILAKDNEGVVIQTRLSIKANSEPNKVKKIRMVVPEIHLNVSYLDFFFCFLDKNTAEVYDWKRNLRLTIRPDMTTISRLILPIRWELET